MASSSFAGCDVGANAFDVGLAHAREQTIHLHQGSVDHRPGRPQRMLNKAKPSSWRKVNRRSVKLLLRASSGSGEMAGRVLPGSISVVGYGKMHNCTQSG